MPRKGWTSIDVPDGWLQVLRGKRPPAQKWPKAERKSAVPQPLAQRGSRVPAHTPGQGSRVPKDPDTFIAEARARVGKLEVAINAFGENDPAVSFLKEALQVAQAQCQVRPVDQRIEATQEFIVRAKKRIQGAREEVTRAQEAADAAIAKLRNEEESLQQGEARLASLQEEAAGASQRQVPPPVPSDLADDLAHLGECVNDLRRERDELRHRSTLQIEMGGWSLARSPSLATPSLDLMITDHRQTVLTPRATQGWSW